MRSMLVSVVPFCLGLGSSLTKCSSPYKSALMTSTRSGLLTASSDASLQGRAAHHEHSGLQAGHSRVRVGQRAATGCCRTLCAPPPPFNAAAAAAATPAAAPATALLLPASGVAGANVAAAAVSSVGLGLGFWSTARASVSCSQQTSNTQTVLCAAHP